MNEKQATPHAELIAELMNPNTPKNDREHAAVREIERLQEVLAQPEFLSTNEADIAQLIEERDVREDILDKVLDMVLGIERPEWSSSYQYIDAVEDVCEALAQPDNTAKLYEELRSIIDGNSESFTHRDAVHYLKEMQDWEALAADQAMTIAMMKIEQEPVAGQSRFIGSAEWSRCSAEHVRMVLASPHEWEGYEVRYLFTSPPQRQLESTTDMMLGLAERLGELPDDVDPRAWSHLLVYAPKKQWIGLTEWEREAIAVECGAMSADWLVFVEAVERALKEKNL